MSPPRTPPGAAPPGLLPQQQFQMHYRLAEEFRDSGRHAAAAEQYQLALKTSGGQGRERLDAKLWLGHSCLLLGNAPEALDHYSAVFYETWHRPEFHRLAYRGLFQSIESLRGLHRAEALEEGAPLRRRLALIEEGLRWLRAIGKPAWRSALLLQKAFVLWALGERATALQEAEAAFQLRLKDQGSPRYVLEFHCEQVTSFAQQRGEYQRGLQAIDTLEGRCERPDEEARIVAHQARLLLALDPPQRQKALGAARRADRLAREIQFPSVQLMAYVALGQTVLAQAHFSQAEDALQRAYLVALTNTTPERPYLLREARRACQEAQGRLAAGVPASRGAQQLQCTLEQWIHELDRALSSATPWLA